jgi:VanZ family protein
MTTQLILIARYPLLRWIAALTFTAFYLLLLFQSQNRPVVTMGIPPGPPSIERELLFAAGHVGMSAVLGVLWYGVLRLYAAPRPALIAMLVLVVLFGLATEWGQAALTADRGASLLDLSADTLGGCIAAGIVLWWERRN